MRADLWNPPCVPVSAFLVLMREREELYGLIDARAKRMWDDGLLAEVRALLSAGYPAKLRPLQALGYRQAVAVIEGRLDEAEALADMRRATRNYAKRQVTWFRRERAAEWVTVHGDEWVEPLAAAILRRLFDPAGAQEGADGGPRPATEGDHP
jgi:tRNA dimethylallyltransferase